MRQTFKCPTCGADVIYEEDEIKGIAWERSYSGTKVVYLPCPNGHIHPYRVESGE
jgi:hypothetical protein